MASFDLAAARADGASDHQIAESLSELTDFNLDAALSDGASYDQIINSLIPIANEKVHEERTGFMPHAKSALEDIIPKVEEGVSTGAELLGMQKTAEEMKAKAEETKRNKTHFAEETTQEKVDKEYADDGLLGAAPSWINRNVMEPLGGMAGFAPAMAALPVAGTMGAIGTAGGLGLAATQALANTGEARERNPELSPERAFATGIGTAALDVAGVPGTGLLGKGAARLVEKATGRVTAKAAEEMIAKEATLAREAETAKRTADGTINTAEGQAAIHQAEQDAARAALDKLPDERTKLNLLRDFAAGTASNAVTVPTFMAGREAAMRLGTGEEQQSLGDIAQGFKENLPLAPVFGALHAVGHNPEKVAREQAEQRVSDIGATPEATAARENLAQEQAAKQAETERTTPFHESKIADPAAVWEDMRVHTDRADEDSPSWENLPDEAKDKFSGQINELNKISTPDKKNPEVLVPTKKVIKVFDEIAGPSQKPLQAEKEAWHSTFGEEAHPYENIPEESKAQWRSLTAKEDHTFPHLTTGEPVPTKQAEALYKKATKPEHPYEDLKPELVPAAKAYDAYVKKSKESELPKFRDLGVEGRKTVYDQYSNAKTGAQEITQADMGPILDTHAKESPDWNPEAPSERVPYTEQEVRPKAEKVEPVAQEETVTQEPVAQEKAIPEDNNHVYEDTTPSENDTGHTVESLKEHMTPEMRKMVDSGKAVLHDTHETLPSDVISPETVKGLVTPEGVAHFVASKLTPENLHGVFLHEVGVHAGMAKMLGPKVWENVKSQVLTQAGKPFEEARKAVPSDTPDHLKAEEIVAHLVEHSPNLPVVKRITSAIRNFARQHLGADLKVTEHDLRHLAEKAVRHQVKLSKAEPKAENRYSRVDEKPIDTSSRTKSSTNEDVFKDGEAKLVVNTKSTQSPRPQSIIDFVVPEDQRNKGIGTKLLKQAVKKYPDIGGQVSSLASLKVFWNSGFRNPEIPEGSFKDHVDMYHEWGDSLFMTTPSSKKTDIRYSRIPDEAKALSETGNTMQRPEKEEKKKTTTEEFVKKYVDNLYGLTKTLDENLPDYFHAGKFRADKLLHDMSQAMNKMNHIFKTGMYKVNDDGTVGVMQVPVKMSNGHTRNVSLETMQDQMDKLGSWGREAFQNAAFVYDKQSLAKRDPRKLPEKYRKDTSLLTKEVAMADALVAKHPEIRDALNSWHALNKSNVDGLYKSGLISPQQHREWSTADFYMPNFVLNEEVMSHMGVEKAEGIKVGNTMTKVFRERTGDEHTINAWENMAKHITSCTLAVMANEGKKAAAEQLTHLGNAHKVDASKKFERGNFAVMENGKRVFYKLDDPSIVPAMVTIHNELGGLFKLARGTSRLISLANTNSPKFWLSELIRNPIQASLTNDLGWVTPVDAMKYMISPMSGRKKEITEKLKAAGVIGVIHNTVDPREHGEFIKNIGKGAVEKGSISKGKTKVINALNKTHVLIDAATKVNIYEMAFKKAKKDFNYTDAQANTYAIMKARESFMPAMRGNSEAMQNLKYVMPFLASQIFGIEQMRRAAMGAGVPKAQQKAFRRKVASKVATAGFMAGALSLYFLNNAQYQAQGAYDTLPFPTGTGDNDFVNIPLPKELSFIKWLPEMMMQYSAGTRAGDAILKSATTLGKGMLPAGIGETLVPIPAFVKIPAEVITNYNFHTGRGIETPAELTQPVANRGENRVARAADWLSKHGGAEIGLSPAKIEYIAKGLGGQLVGVTMWGMDNVLPEINDEIVERPSTDIWSNPVLFGNMIPNPNKSVYKSDFYDEVNRADEIHAQAEKYKKAGDREAYNELINSGNNRALYKVSTNLNRIKKEIGDLNKQINAVKTAPNTRFTPERRKELIDKYTQMANQKAKIGNDMYRKATGQ